MAKSKGKVGRWVGFGICLVLFIAVNIAISIFSGYGDLYFGGKKTVVTHAEGTENWDTQYYKSDYSSVEAVESAAEALVEKIESEGIVLLKNNGALPLNKASESKVTLLGRDAADPVYGGSGSGGVDLSSVVDIKTALEKNGFTVNPDVYKVLSDYASYSEKQGAFGSERVYDHPKANIVMDNPAASTYYIGEMPASGYDAVRSSFSSYNGAGIVVIGRGGGEGGDLAQDLLATFDRPSAMDRNVAEVANYVSGQHQLELTKEERDTITLAKQNFDKVIVIINASTQMELGDLEKDTGVDAIVWIGSPGQSGFRAVAKVLDGTVNPSGRTPDIYAADFTKDPTFVNFGNNQYSNISKSNAIGDAFFVQYEEGIYVGYKYYETAAVEGFINYDEAVVYPFGYGLSYTTFDWEITGKKTGNTDGSISVDVKVTNTGSVAGKDVVELYYSAPYYKGGIEKSAVNLADFAKTNLLKPGESQTLTLSLAVEDMASYDYKNHKAYVLEHGNYVISVRSDSHTVKAGCEEINYNVSRDIVYDKNNKRDSDKTAATNLFDDVSDMFRDNAQSGYAINFSRADFAGTFPTAPTDADRTARPEVVAGWQAYKAADHADSKPAPTFNKKNGLSVITMRGVDYDDPLWEDFLDQADKDELVHLVLSGAYNTAELPALGVPGRTDFDGPAGFSSFMTPTHGMAYTTEVVIAATFNKALAHEMGVMLGEEGLQLNLQGWYAPAMNCHRSPFAGRNFEYYSEDGVLAGKIATEVVAGAGDKGLVTFIKHFAMNDQETNRVNQGNSHWANEQAIREIYLKPFEICVKNAYTTLRYISDDKGTVSEKPLKANLAVMSSFNRIGSTWAGGSHALQEDVLRGEWGYEGFVLTDFNLYDYMYTNQGIHNGTDVMLTFEAMKTIEDKTSPTALNDLRKVAHRVSYTAANSAAMNGIAPGDIVSYKMATWQVIRLVISIILGLALVCWCALNIKNTLKKN